MKWRITFAVLTLTALNAFAQAGPDPVFSHNYGGAGDDWAQTVLTMPDKGYLLAGTADLDSGGKSDFYLVKTDSAGAMLWSKKYGGGDDDILGGAALAPDGGFILAGSTLSFGSKTMTSTYLVRTNAMGDTLWTHFYPNPLGSMAEDVIACADGGYALIGRVGTAGEGHNMYLLKTDSVGRMQWEKNYGGKAWDDGEAVRQTSDGGFILAGRTESYGAGKSDVYVVRTNAVGDTLWTREFGGHENERGHDVVIASDGGFLVAGETRSFGKGLEDFYAIRLDSKGDTLWTRVVGGAKEDIAKAVIQTLDGGYVLAGHTTSRGMGDSDVELVKLDSGGRVVWTQTYGGKRWDVAESVQQTADGGFVIAGATRSFGKGTQFYFVKTKPDLAK